MVAKKRKKRRLMVSKEFKKTLDKMMKKLPEGSINTMASFLGKSQAWVSTAMNGFGIDHDVWNLAKEILAKEEAKEAKFIKEVDQLIN